MSVPPATAYRSTDGMLWVAIDLAPSVTFNMPAVHAAAFAEYLRKGDPERDAAVMAGEGMGADQVVALRQEMAAELAMAIGRAIADFEPTP